MDDTSYWYRVARQVVNGIVAARRLSSYVDHNGAFDREDLIQEAVTYYLTRKLDWDENKSSLRTFLGLTMAFAVNNYISRKATGFAGMSTVSNSDILYVDHVELDEQQTSVWDSLNNIININIIDIIDINNKLINIILNRLDEQTAHIVLKYYRLEDEDIEYTLRDLADLYDLTYQNIHAKIQRALIALSTDEDIKELYLLTVGELDG